MAPSIKSADITDKIYSRWASGGDASGRHSIYRSCKSDAGKDNRNIILGGQAMTTID